MASSMGLAERIDWARADAVIAARAGIARQVTALPASDTPPRPFSTRDVPPVPNPTIIDQHPGSAAGAGGIHVERDHSCRR
jgi:hypothetical protein